MAEHSKPKHRKLPAWMMNMNTTRSVKRKDEQLTHVTHDKANLRFMGTIRYCQTEEECSTACEDLMKQAGTQEEMVLGFDMEWPIDFKAGSGKTALIQICAEEQTCFLFHVNCMRNLPEPFVHLLQHPKVKLVGVNIRNDLWKLSRDFEMTVKPLIESRVVELGELANKTLQSGQRWSLDRLVLHVLKMKLDKNDTVRKSDWRIQDLSAIQQCYAATDAYASLLVYNYFKVKQTSGV